MEDTAEGRAMAANVRHRTQKARDLIRREEGGNQGQRNPAVEPGNTGNVAHEVVVPEGFNTELLDIPEADRGGQ